MFFYSQSSSTVKHVQIRSNLCVNSPTQTNSTNSAGGKTLLGTHKHQGAFPDTLPTNSLMVRVFPVPQAISIFLAPFAQASKQSCWHFLNGGSEGMASSWMPVLEAAPLATSLRERQLVATACCHSGTATCSSKYNEGSERSGKHCETRTIPTHVAQKCQQVESSTAADPSFLTNPRLFIIVRVTPLN